MVGKTNTKAKYSTCVGTRYENGFVNNFETHGASYLPGLFPLASANRPWVSEDVKYGVYTREIWPQFP